MQEQDKINFFERSIEQLNEQMSTLRIMMQSENGLDYDWHEQTVMALRKIIGYYNIDLHLLTKNQT